VELSPFPYQGPLNPEQVRGRDDLVLDLVERITSRRVTALLGPRRFGKTSVLRRVSADLSEVDTVWVDLYEVTSMADVAVRFDDGLAATTGRFSELARRFALTLSLNLGLVKVQMTGPARNRPDPSAALHSLLEVLVRSAEETPTLLVVDEFSSVNRVDGAAGALRTAVQGHYQDIGLVFAGSQPSMMRTLFSDRPQPFYGQADLVEIGPLSAEVVEDIVTSGFSATDRQAGRLGGLIFTFAGGHPQRTMQIADACWRHTRPKGRGHDAWAAALAEVRLATADGMERLYSRYSPGERAVLRAVAQSGSVYGAEAELLDLAKGTATHARRALIDAGDLAEIEGDLRVVDPLLADWIRSRFPL
jgi:hypothetical protein